MVHLLAFRSLVHQWWSSRVWNLRSSGFCSFVAFGAPSLSLFTPARAAVPLTFVAISGQLVGGQGCWGFEGSRWKAQRPVSAVRQGGVSVNVRVADLSPGRIGDKKTEVVADGLPHFHGARLAVDATLVSPVRPGGNACETQERYHVSRACPPTGRQRTSCGFGIGNRVRDGRDVVSQLAKAKSRREPPQLRMSARRAWFRRWNTLLACSVLRPLASGAPRRLWHRRGDPFDPPRHVKFDSRFHVMANTIS